ncbi:CBF/Mak21 family [Rhizoctonia solani]|uniref:CBF/Mak21 family n=1 Tax=Rhizoctonia solani TaxID=456999 RepID=A0A8H7IJL2_9AGAM|nr:CBF/Mak21 family [Rhizoctonia solani]
MLSGYPLSRSQFSVLCYYTPNFWNCPNSDHHVAVLTPPQKKRKLASGDSKVKELEGIEANINKSLAEGGSLNCLVDLLDIARSSSDPAFLHKVLYSLYRSCVSIAASPKINLSKCQTEESKVVRTWLLERIGEFTDLLCGLMTDEEKALRTAALQILMSMLKHLSTAFSTASNMPQIHSIHFRKIVGALLLCPSSSRDGPIESEDHHKVQPDLRDTFIDTWLSSYDDVRWFFFRDATTSPGSREPLVLLERLKTMPTEAAELNAYWIIELGTKPPKTPHGPNPPGDEPEEPTPADQDDWRTFFDDAPSAKSATQNPIRLECIHSQRTNVFTRSRPSRPIFCLLDDPASSHRIIAITRGACIGGLASGVMPHMDKPVRLMDWVGGCVDFGGSIGLLALNALFTLIKDYNLLTDIFLSSTHLPAAILASFIKRLARLSLTAPPAAIIMIIPFVYNVLKRHPALMVMIHRVDDEAELDPFDEKETSPLRTNALESSLWELVSHRDHYLSSVSTLAKIFSEAFTKPSYALEDFLDHTYATLFETEAKRKLKKDPAVAWRRRLTYSLQAPSGKVKQVMRVSFTTTSTPMSHPEPSKTSEDQSEAYVSDISGPRNFSSIEYDVRSDIQHLVWNRVSHGMGEEGATVDRQRPETESKMTSLLKRHRKNSVRSSSSLFRISCAGVVIDTPGASLFFWRFWEAVVDLATMTKPHLWAAGDKMLISSHDWETLVEARKLADAKMDRAIELPVRWADLPLLEPIVKDFQYGLFSAISNHEDLLKPRIQRYICGAILPEAGEIQKGPVRELINLRWKWLQLQRFSAKLWNSAGRPEYFPHAIRVLDALACFAPPDTGLPPMSDDTVPEGVDDSTKAGEPGSNINGVTDDNSPADQETVNEIDGEPVIPPLDLSFYYSLPEPFEEWTEPPAPRPPTVLQLLLAEGAAIWPLSVTEKTWFASAQETQQERDERWMKWKRGLAAVFAWCTNGHSGMPGEATVLIGVTRALRIMTQAEKDARRYLTKGQQSI